MEIRPVFCPYYNSGKAKARKPGELAALALPALPATSRRGNLLRANCESEHVCAHIAAVGGIFPPRIPAGMLFRVYVRRGVLTGWFLL